jgi:signal transduction histidine kinase
LLVFISGIIAFVFQYHKRRLVFDREKLIMSEQHKQDLLNTKLEIQLQTMQDIGREIHDNVGQKLTLASIYAHQYAFENKLAPGFDRIANIGSIIDEALQELRVLSKNLTNNNADIAELKDLVQNECKRVNALNLCQVTLRFIDANFKISTTIKNFILRIIQEFLQNSLKHANCQNIYLDFDFRESGLYVQAKDDGVGFDKNLRKDLKSEGIGLMRAELIGADFSINSILNRGTELKLFIPENKLNYS